MIQIFYQSIYPLEPAPTFRYMENNWMLKSKQETQNLLFSSIFWQKYFVLISFAIYHYRQTRRYIEQNICGFITWDNSGMTKVLN